MVEEVVEVGVLARVRTVEVTSCEGDVVAVGEPSQGSCPLHDGVEVGTWVETVNYILC